MARVDIARVVVRRAGWRKKEWRAVSYGANGKKIAWTETYKRIADAEAAARTISDGAPIRRED